MICPAPPHCGHGWLIEKNPWLSLSTPRPLHRGQVWGIVLIAPYVLFGPVCGWLADRFAKHRIIQVALLLPIIMTLQNWFRGELAAARATPAVSLAMVANLSMMVLVLAWGVANQVRGVRLAGIALTLSVSAETLTLWAASRRVQAVQRAIALAQS